ncbi:hypothetical protein Tco_0395269, partial [Tanacetum coccineum]
MNYLKNQGTWKLSQLKNLSFEEVKEEFDKLTSKKRLKSDKAKDDEPTKQIGKRRKHMARKGLHTDLDKDDSEDSDEASEQDDSASDVCKAMLDKKLQGGKPDEDCYKLLKWME